MMSDINDVGTELIYEFVSGLIYDITTYYIYIYHRYILPAGTIVPVFDRQDRDLPKVYYNNSLMTYVEDRSTNTFLPAKAPARVHISADIYNYYYKELLKR